VLQEVDGDFVAQVKVTADWNPDVPSSQYYYYGAGLLVWDSEKQYLRMERNTFQRNVPPTGIFCFITPMYDRNDRRINAEMTARNDFYNGRSTWLRIDRAGDKLTTAVSHDGTQWTETGVLMTDFPKRVRVGIHANITSPREFVAEFEEFKIARKQ
jgi:regulation of enolase protein 1 (concanavalin A-like superfamily)